MKALGEILAPLRDGNLPATISEQLVKTSSGHSPPLKGRAMNAAKAVDRLFDLLPPQDVGDPKAFMASVAAIFSQYPDAVVEAAVGGPRGVATRTDRPTLKFIREVCEEFYAPIQRQAERDANASQPKLLPRPPRTAEEQERIDKQVAAVRFRFGIPEGSARRCPIMPPSADLPIDSPVPPPADGRHYERIKAELEGRRARRDVEKQKAGGA
jgi:hypothetical protein